ncbi:MAG: T9SS type A sorting domain-containing protein [Saprospiraceae bacterium]|jgi:aminopeptidase N|nr:T9SS type A sorting domain-containing protein [Saprospiraceae bacterium]MBX7179419.1 T9SS type A sorting domain-containing protein [Saprospiraceae bacterium]MCB0590585.1 T9SS type A sorting domain-containing protein [Saprospiraceae bacterium]HMY83332.1 M1 family aminopeptidase [Saprospiraceae bacterium]HNA76103.1 M1 family aminopeptidase [Saprospiraceae bacterium]
MSRLFFITIALFYSLYLTAQDTDPNHIPCSKASAYRNPASLNNFHNPLTENYDLKYYRFDWYIDPADYYIKGSATPYFEVLTNEFKEIYFDLSNQLQVDSVLYHGLKINYSQPDQFVLKINFDVQIGIGTLDSLTIYYRGVPPAGGFGSFIQSKHGDNIPVIWTLSEPFGAQDWWPCKNGLDDKIDSIDVFVTSPDQYRCASNGILVDEIRPGPGLMRAHWKHRHPIAAYLVAIAVTDYTVYTDDVHLKDGTVMPMLNYVYPESLSKARKGTSDNVRVLEFFDSLFVDYPFKKEKYGHAQFGWGGGMEHQTMSYVTGFDWGLLAHELGHQWFGDHVTCGSWEDIWLNEGFATYLDGLSRERFFEPSYWYNWKFNLIKSITSRPDGSVWVANTDDVSRIFHSRLTYNKGAYLVHMLRWKLGDEIFFKSLRTYLNKKGGGFARVADLKGILEDVSGESLGEYFDDWFYGEGYPVYSVTWDSIHASPEQVLIRLDQTTSHTSVDFFEMPVPIRLQGEGKEMTVRLDNTSSGQVFTIEPGFKVEKVEFDPDLWLLAKSSVAPGAVLADREVPEYGIQCFPNPAHNDLVINVNSLKFKGLSWRIIDVSGKLILKGELNAPYQRINIAGLTAGAYRMLISDSQHVVSVHSFSRI